MAATPVPTVGDVIQIAAANLNDSQQAIWTNARLMPHIKSAVNWLASQIANISTQPFEKVVGAPYTNQDLPYTGGMCDLTPILPADIYEPISLDFRLNTGSQWQSLGRTTQLGAAVPAAPQLLTEWEWSNRTLRVQPASENCLLRLRYLALMPGVSDAGSPIPIDNCVQALGFAAAANAYSSRGQKEQAATMWGQEKDPPSGAMMYLGLVLGIIIKNEQILPRRPVPFSSGTWGGSWRYGGVQS